MTIRPARTADFPTLLAVQVASIKSLTHTYQPEEIQAWVDYIEAEGPDRYAPLESAVIENNETRIQAFVSWSIKDNAAKIDCLFALPEDQSRGFGARLLEYAEKRISGEKIQIRATLSAQAFYEKYGYAFVEFTTSRAGFAIALMEKHL